MNYQEETEQQETEQSGTVQPGSEHSIENQKRKLIRYKPPTGKMIDDPLELKPNKSSVKARRVFIKVENITFELWFDKHYLDRHHHGDDSGKREGIEPEVVENLVRRSLKHMVYYSTVVAGFSFSSKEEHTYDRYLRIVLQEQSDYGLLNVVIETHCLGINNYELTVKTAMCIDDFQLSEGQYIIELDGDGSILKKFDSKKIRDVCAF